MSRVGIWFERKFDFSYPIELLPNLLARLRGTAARLASEFRDIDQERMVAKQAESWSAQEHAGHLLDMEPLWLARLDDFVAGTEELTAADLTNRKTHEANHNSRPLNAIVLEFQNARQELLRRADELEISKFNQTIPHPRLRTPMRLIDHLYFVAEHDDHHLAKIWELLHSPEQTP